jgi:hypothetical protein
MSVSGANAGFEKREAYAAAKKLLAQGDDASVRYAALELRRCLEAIVYEKLTSYGDLLPEGSMHRWQPPKAFDALVEIEPNAQETFTCAIGAQKDLLAPSTGPFQQIGVDERPRAKWVKDTWSKLGFYLHAEWPFARKQKAKKSLRDFLEKILGDIAALADNAVSVVMFNVIDFPCSACGANVKIMAKSVEVTGRAVCFTCGMRYRAEKAGGGFTFVPVDSAFTCECGVASYLPADDVRPGYKFECRACAKKYVIVAPIWPFAAVEDQRPEAQGTCE